MYYVYLLKSQKTSRLYTGRTADLKTRFSDHNAGKSPYTKNGRPWKLIYYESYLSKEDAMQRERSLKLRSNAYKQLRARIQTSINEHED